MSTPVSHEYIPTIIDSSSLLPRLAFQLSSLQRECVKAWPDFKRHPFLMTDRLIRSTARRVMNIVFTRHTIAAFTVVVLITTTAMLVDHALVPMAVSESDEADVKAEIRFLDLREIKNSNPNGIGRNGTGRVGFARGNGEGSAKVRRNAQGGGSGGDNEPLPPQIGKLPPPSTILAAIPKVPPVHTQSLPVAGIDIDPALWRDERMPVFGDPTSQLESNSKGPGTGGGFGTNRGLGIGPGEGPGVGPGKDGNTGGGPRELGCCGVGDGTSGRGREEILAGREVEQRARLISKPEPQYTEEARRNQVTGTVTLRVVFSSIGSVEQIRALQTLPFGLTEKAIAAARQIKFVPAMKGGRSVSVWMQLEYNFNLY